MPKEIVEIIPLIGQGFARDVTLAVLAPAFADAGLADEPIDLVFEKVERAKQEWETTVDSLPELVCVIDDRGCIVRANRTVEAWQLGSVKTVPGLSVHSMLHSQCIDPACPLVAYFQRATANSNNQSLEPFEIFDPVLQRQLLLKMRPITASRPDLPITAVIVIEDVTERRRNEEALNRSLARLAAMNEMQRSILAASTPEEIAEAALSRIRPLVAFRQARLALCNADDDGVAVLTADANGVTHLRPFHQCTLADLQFGDPHRLADDFAVDDLRQATNLSSLEQQLLQDGMRSFANVPLVTGGVFIGSLLLASDRISAFTSEQLQVAREIGDLLTIAVHQARLHRQVQQVNMQLRSALRVKEELIQNVSHELRTPIGLIYGYTSLIKEGELGTITPDQDQALDVMLKQEEQLRFMVERLVDLRSSHAMQLYRVPLDVTEWVTLVAQPWQRRTQLHGHSIHVEIELPAITPRPLADAEAMKQVLDNLLDNAVKFSPRGSSIQIRAELDSDTVLVSVRDQGIGLVADQVAQIFEMFYQVDGSTKRRYGGMGVGLTLCRDIMAAHGGQIWAESAGKGQGSTFFLALPLERSMATDTRL